MKKSLLVLALAVASLPAFAQVGVDSASNAGASAATGDIGITSIVNLPNSNPMSYQTLGYSGGYTQTFKGQPVSAGAASFATPAVWRCATAGAGGALQLKDFALSFALPGGESSICPREFRIAIIGGIADRALFAQKKDLSDSEKKIAQDAYAAMHAEACGDDEMANSLEHTVSMKCAEPINSDTRKARWDREREIAAAKAANRPVAMLPGVPAVAPSPKPWMAGG